MIQFYRFTWTSLTAIFITTLLVTVSVGQEQPVLLGSDHADPMQLNRLEDGITDLFAFKESDHIEAMKRIYDIEEAPSLEEDYLVLILCVRRALNGSGEFNIEKTTYNIFIDTTSNVSDANEDSNRRYGGHVTDPAGIEANLTISFKLKNDLTYREGKTPIYHNFEETERIVANVAIRDDPFIFPRFYGTNVISMMVRIPISDLPEPNGPWLIWANSERGKKRQIDHVGRSNRTMLPRFDFLNRYAPSEHVREIRRRHEHPTLIRDIARTYIEPLFAFRPFDQHPDVMIFDLGKPTAYPNGRLLTDDVAKLTADHGDCLLYELSYRPGVHDAPWREGNFSKDGYLLNDRQFLVSAPFLARPWDESTQPPPPSLTLWSKIQIGLIVVGLILLLVIEHYFVLRWLWRRKRRREYL